MEPVSLVTCVACVDAASAATVGDGMGVGSCFGDGWGGRETPSYFVLGGLLDGVGRAGNAIDSRVLTGGADMRGLTSDGGDGEHHLDNLFFMFKFNSSGPTI